MPKPDVPPLWRQIKNAAATNPVLQKALNRCQQGWTKEQALIEAALTLAVVRVTFEPVLPSYQDVHTHESPALLDALATAPWRREAALEIDLSDEIPAAEPPQVPPNREITEGFRPTCADGRHSDPGRDGRCCFCGRIVDGSVD